MINWLKRKMGLLSLAMAKVEKNSLGQSSDALGNIDGTSQTYNQGTLSDALLKGEITLPVKELRWRLYKVLSESKGRTASIVGYDEDGLPIVETLTVDKYALDNVIRDDIDPYSVNMVVYNKDITKSTLETFNGSEYNKEATDNFNLIGATVVKDSKTLGEVSFDNMMSMFKDKKTLYVTREYRPKFELEAYTKKLMVRNINEDEKMLEFYVSKYPDEYNRKSRLLIGELRKLITKPAKSDIIDIDRVGFITDKTIGSVDGLEYEYEITSFDKIIEFNGCYVIKFISKVLVNGDNIFEKYKELDLEERYKNKEAK